MRTARPSEFKPTTTSNFQVQPGRRYWPKEFTTTRRRRVVVTAAGGEKTNMKKNGQNNVNTDFKVVKERLLEEQYYARHEFIGALRGQCEFFRIYAKIRSSLPHSFQ